jgi:hypothetical protein
MRRLGSGAVVLAFGGPTCAPVAQHGPVGIFADPLQILAGLPVLADLGIALLPVRDWRWRDTRGNWPRCPGRRGPQLAPALTFRRQACSSGSV